MSHPDATGYLADLNRSIGVPWFALICDLAAEGRDHLTPLDLEVLVALFLKKASHRRFPGALSEEHPPQVKPEADFLEGMSGFSNFKNLSDTLTLTFKKRVTIIFGANGSGKSSLCEALRSLANADGPRRPLNNVRKAIATAPTFCAKFKSEGAPLQWTPAHGFGIRQKTLKYFDTSIASANISVAVDPGRVVEVAPFKLSIFERVTTLVNAFRNELSRQSTDCNVEVSSALAQIKGTFGAHQDKPIATMDIWNQQTAAAVVAIGRGYIDDGQLEAKTLTLADLEKATSDDGLKILQAEEKGFRDFGKALTALIRSTTSLEAIGPMTKRKQLEAKQAAQGELAGALIPAGAVLKDILDLAEAASRAHTLVDPHPEACPLCAQDLGERERQRFQLFSDLIKGELQAAIGSLQTELATADQHLQVIASVEPGAFLAFDLVPDHLKNAAYVSAMTITRGCEGDGDVSAKTSVARDALATIATDAQRMESAKTDAISAAKLGQTALLATLESTRVAVAELQYAARAADCVDTLHATAGTAALAATLRTGLGDFQGLLKKITEGAKRAHENLIVGDFEKRLNEEYVRLSEMSMASFGVTLLRKGSESTVTVQPKIHGEEIASILSEGELRTHALALFFAELETGYHGVVVFDDPVSSFDYNNVEHYCCRLRDYARDHQDRQIIVLTHNWEFFIQLQSELDKARMQHDFAVLVLEERSSVTEYEEKVDALKKRIGDILESPADLSSEKKSEACRLLRRLIESVVNAHVFANQRFQFKSKGQKVSDFESYTKIVPLLASEAGTLRDLYSRLSPNDHDDPKTFYATVKRDVLVNRFDAIKNIEIEIIRRKP